MKRILLALAVLWPILTLCCLPEVQAQFRLPDRNSTALDTTNKLRETSRQLTDTIFAIEEVEINTGYQRIPKERATGSFVFVDSALLNRSVSTDIISRLKGVAPSLLFDERAGGEPKLSIRGRSTIFANADPLIVVDNFPYEGDLNNINPNDVESVTILRDAAAASIWGVRAGNGVIVITTKQGKAGQPLQVSLNSNVTVGARPDLWYEPRISPADLVEVERFLFEKGHYTSRINNTTTFPVISPVLEILTNPALDEEQRQAMLGEVGSHDLRTDLSRYYYQRSLNQQHTLQMMGGQERTQYVLNFGIDQDKPYKTETGSQRYTVSGKLNLSLTDRLAWSSNLSYVQKQDKLNSGSPYPERLETYVRLADDGNHLPVARDHRLSFAETATEKGLLPWLYVPLDELYNNHERSARHHLRLNQGLRYTWYKGFRTELLYQYEKQFGSETVLNDEDSYFYRNLVNRFSVPTPSSVKHNVPMGAYRSVGHNELTAHNARLTGTYSGRWDNHDLDILGGMEIRQVSTIGQKQLIYGYDVQTGLGSPVNHDSLYRQYPSGTLARIFSDNNVSGTLDRFRSYFFNGGYTYLNRYSLSASMRVDQSNIFGVKTNQRSVPLWSSGVKWTVSQEPFFRSGWLPLLQLRATYGYNGNLDSRLTAYTTASYARQVNTGLRFATINSLPNNQLRWEKTSQLNLALDFGLGQRNVVSGNVDYYIKNGIDLIGDSPIDPTSGNRLFRGNMANMKGHGVDVELRVVPGKGRAGWEAVALFSYTADKVVKYDVDPQQVAAYFGDASLLGGNYTPKEGMPLFGVYSNKFAGLDPATGSPRGYLNGLPSTDYTAMSRNRAFDSLYYHGRVMPPFFGALRQVLTYGDFALSVNVTYKLGHYFRRPSIRYDQLFASNRGHADFADRWMVAGDENHTHVPSMSYPNVAGRDDFYANSSALVENAGQIRLEDLQLNYTVRSAGLSRRWFDAVNIYLYMSRVGILWRANDQKIDPDYAVGMFPQPFSLSVGTKINF